jgi:hypothetical protein
MRMLHLEADYEIQVKTSNDFQTGTDDTVLVSLYGTMSELLDIPLKQPENNLRAFEKDKLDRFFFDQMKNIGTLKQMKLKLEPIQKVGMGLKVDFIKVYYDNSAYT